MALDYINKALNIDNRYFEAYLQRIKANKLLLQLNSFKNNAEITTAFQLVDDKLKKEPNNQDYLIDKGNLYLLTENYPAAIKIARKILTNNPDNYEAGELLASSLKLSGNFIEAITVYTSLMLKFPDDEKQFGFLLATAYQKSNKPEKSILILNDLIRKYPNDFGLYLGRASVYTLMGNTNAAENDINKATVLAPDNYLPFKNAYEFYKINGRATEAQNSIKTSIDLISSQIKRNADNPDLLFARADIYESINNFNGALADYSKILESWPENYYALKKSARLYLKLNNLKEAIDTYNNLIANYPGEAEFYNNLGMIYLQTNKPKEALTNFSKAIEFDNDNIDLLNNRARMYLQIKDKNAAKLDLLKVKNILERKIKENKFAKSDETTLNQVNNMLKSLN